MFIAGYGGRLAASLFLFVEYTKVAQVNSYCALKKIKLGQPTSGRLPRYTPFNLRFDPMKP